MSTNQAVSDARAERVQNVVDVIERAPFAALDDADVAAIVADVRAGRLAQALEVVERDSHVHFACGNMRKGDVIAAVANAIGGLYR